MLPRSFVFQRHRCGFGFDRGLFMRGLRLWFIEVAWSDVLITEQLDQLHENLIRARDALRSVDEQ